MLNNVSLLREGEWPPEPKDSGYIDSPISKRAVKGEAPFIKPASVIAELDIRLENTRTDGLMLEAHYGWGKSSESLAKHLRITEGDVSRRMESALSFITGWKRKKVYEQRR